MCGICGIVSDSGLPDLALLRRMMGRLGHRGPDGNGWYRDRRAALGHTRLAIIDTAGGAQPLCNEDGTVWVTYNGEIFNYVELGEELRHLGHTFRTASDTEVIVHAWEEWGEECFPRFNGQWALALWDRRAERLVLSRDRLGVRPLFYVRRPGGLLFASEVKSVFADPSVERAFDPAGLDQTFTYWSPVAPRTVFRGIEQLEPGHYAVLDSGGFRKAPYWRATFPPRGREPGQDVRENAEALRERIIEAARLRFLRSDVPVGAYLSGGLDSSVTAAVIARYTSARLHTFSLRFADSEFDEGLYQKKMSAVLGTQHQDIVVSPSDIAAVFPEVIRHAEAPILRAAPAPLFLLSKLVRENGYKVVVTGEGADEVLAGYDLFREARVRLFWSRDPGSAKRTRAAELLYPWMARSPGQIPAFARSFFGRHLDPDDPALSHRPRWDSTSVIKSMLSADLRDRIGRAGAEDVVTAMPPGSADWDPLSRGQWLEMTTLLAGYILAAQGDRMLMANSVEGRFPFLDAGRRRFRERAASPAQAVRPGGEVPPQARLRRSRPGRHHSPAETALPGPGRRELLRGWRPGLVRRGHVAAGRRSGRRVRTVGGGRPAGEVQADRRGEHEQHRQHAGARDRFHAAHTRRFHLRRRAGSAGPAPAGALGRRRSRYR